MFSPRRKPRSLSSRTGTTLDRKQDALREKEERLKQETEQLRRLIENAPRIREEQTRRRREQLAADPRFTSGTAVVDRRYDAYVGTHPGFGQRPLRKEKRDGKFLFLCLLVTLGALVIWIAKMAMML